MGFIFSTCLNYTGYLLVCKTDKSKWMWTYCQNHMNNSARINKNNSLRHFCEFCVFSREISREIIVTHFKNKCTKYCILLIRTPTGIPYDTNLKIKHFPIPFKKNLILRKYCDANIIFWEISQQKFLLSQN